MWATNLIKMQHLLAFFYLIHNQIKKGRTSESSVLIRQQKYIALIMNIYHWRFVVYIVKGNFMTLCVQTSFYQNKRF